MLSVKALDSPKADQIAIFGLVFLQDMVDITIK